MLSAWPESILSKDIKFSRRVHLEVCGVASQLGSIFMNAERRTYMGSASTLPSGRVQQGEGRRGLRSCRRGSFFNRC